MGYFSRIPLPFPSLLCLQARAATAAGASPLSPAQGINKPIKRALVSCPGAILGVTLIHSCGEMRLQRDTAAPSCCAQFPSHVAVALICLSVPVLATPPALLCMSERHPIKGDNQPSSCEPQRGCCILHSPPLVPLFSLGEEQLPEAPQGKDCSVLTCS